MSMNRFESIRINKVAINFLLTYVQCQMYTVLGMSLTATELRKKLFPILDSVSSGTSVEFNYKGKTMKIVAEMGTSKLARLRPQSYTVGSEREIELAAEEQKKQLQADWLAKWDDQQ